MRIVLPILLLATPAFADLLPSTSDPAFSEPFQRLLQGDDPDAVRALHAAAEAGNPSAVLAMPFALSWTRSVEVTDGSDALFQVNGVHVIPAAMAQDPVAASWWQDPADATPASFLDRAHVMFQAGERAKGTALIQAWFNQTGALEPPPDWIFDYPVDSWMVAIILQYRLQDISGAVPQPEAEADVIARVKADDPAAWMALAGYAALDRDNQAPLPETTVQRINRMLGAAGFSPADGQARMTEMAAQLRALHLAPDSVLDAGAAAVALKTLKATPDFLPVEAVCTAACPGTAEACMTAYVAAFGHPTNATVMEQPFITLITPEDFFATPRSRIELARSIRPLLGDDPATSPALTAAHQIDACFADAVLASIP
jgi:hypothetical protein